MLAFVAERWPAFRHRNFRLFFVGQLASLLGTWMQSAAQLWLVYRLTGSATLLGLIGFANQFPVFLLAPLGGLVSDGFDRRRVLLATQGALMALAFALAALTLTGSVRVGHLLAVATAVGCVNAFDIPVRQAFLSDMVGKTDVMNAVALNASMFHAARMVGPAIGGLVIYRIGEGWCFLTNGISFLAVLASLAAMTPSARTAPPAGGWWSRLLEGLRFAAGTRGVREFLQLLAVVSLFAAPYSVLLPLLAARVLHLDSRGLGGLMAATGAGALSAALLLATRSRPDALPRLVPRATALTGVSLIALAASTHVSLSMLALCGVGFGITTQMASTNTLLQIRVPDAMRGRALAVYAMMFMGLQPVGQLLAGVLAEGLGVAATLAAGGTAALLGAGVFVATRRGAATDNS
jgi:MFS family permease